jgi:hypothetical protein
MADATRDSDRLCNAKKRQGPGLCQRPAGWGTDHAGIGACKLHGGNMRNHRVSAATVQVKRELARLDVTPVDDPLTELAKLAGQVVAWKDALSAKVNELTAIRYQDAKGSEQLRSEIALFERALDRCGNVLGVMAKLNIDERLARVNERQVEIVSQALSAALADMGLDAGQQQEARQGVVRHLRLIAG